LAAGDADAALGYLSEQPTDTTLLTGTVLSASVDSAPIKAEDIKVELKSSKEKTAEVDVTFNIGDKPVEQTYTVNLDKNDWKIDVKNVVATVDVSNLSGFDLEVNGTSTDGLTSLTLFPGSYTLTSAEKYYDLSTPFVVTDPESAKDLGPFTPTLNDAGKEAFRAAVHAAVAECLASPSVTPGCGLPDFNTLLGEELVIIDGTVVQTATPDIQAWLDALSPTVLTSDLTTAFADAPPGGVTVVVSATQSDGQTVTGEIRVNEEPWICQFGAPSVVMTADTLVVTWTSSDPPVDGI
jgi:hypothetical protein